MMKSGEFKVVEDCPSAKVGRRVVHFKSFEVEPFDYEDLRRNNPRKPLQAQVKFRNAVLGDQCENIDVTDEKYQSDFVLRSHFSTKSYTLTQGGWFPPGFTTLDNITYLMDRCAYNDVRAYCHADGDVPINDFVECLMHPGTRINILPLLLEGNRRKLPNDYEVLQQYQEVMFNLKQKLPDANFVPDQVGSFLSVKRILEDPFCNIGREQGFLEDISPLLQSPVGRKRRGDVLSKIRQSADLYSVGKSSFVFLAAVSAAVCPQSLNPARDVLKIRANYGQDDIYNALSDLRCLKILSNMIAILPDENPVFCTSDKNLALFWVGLQGRGFSHSLDEMSFTIDISETLFPNMDSDFFA